MKSIIGRLRFHSAKIALAVFLLAYSAAGIWTARNQRGVDFAVYYLAAHALRNGTNVYTLTDADWTALAQQYNVPEVTPPYRYPPLTAGIVAIFSDASYPTALLIWSALNLIALLISGLALSQLLRRRWIDPLIFAALTFYVPILTSVYAGQANNFVLVGLALYLLLAQRQRWFAAGTALAASVTIKPIALPLYVHLIWRRDFRKFAGLIGGLAIVTILIVVLIGPNVSRDYVENAWQLSTLSTGSAPVTYPPNQSLFGFFGRAFTLHEFGPALFDDPTLAKWLSYAAVGLLLLGVAIVTWPRRERSTDRFALEAGLILVTINLIVPVSWYHHSAISIVSLLLAWHAARSNRLRVMLIAALVLIDLQGILWHQLEGQTFLLSLGTYGLLIIYAVTAFRLRQDRSSAASPEMMA